MFMVKTSRRSASSTQGFTLIELLVVIGILSLLVVAFAPDIIGVGASADKAADQANLKWQYQQIYRYQIEKKRYPKGEGSQWLLGPWVDGFVERTEANFNRYWVPNASDPNKEDLQEVGMDDIWKSIDEITSSDTHYAGRARIVGNPKSGKAAWAANDNEAETPTFDDGSVNVLTGDSNVKNLQIDPDFLEYGWTLERVEEPFPVGEDSEHPLLKQLRR